MRSIWKGAISFGLVNIPIELHTAVRSEERIKFRQLHKKDMSTIKYDRVCVKEEKSVPYEDIVKGYEYTKGKFVVMEDEDFRAASVEKSKSIDITEFVDATDVDPRYFETPYYVLPQKGGEKPYALLREAIRKSGKVGIGMVTMRSNSMHFVCIKVIEDALVLEVLRYADELVDSSTFNFPAADAIKPAELTMAEQLVTAMADKFAPEKYSNTYRDNLMRIIEDKLKGKKIEVPEIEEPEATNVLDLMSRLQESLAQGKAKPAKAKKDDAKPAAKADKAEKAEPKRRPERSEGAKKKRKTA
jgi:DNA end-binding protein Ku